jgi:putative holliday junction resolvase
MARILGVDYGTKRVGLSVSDPLQIIATALDTVATDQIFDYLKKYLSMEEVELFVVGEPLQLDGNESKLMPVIQDFIDKLGILFPHIPVELQDERFTSKDAQRAILLGGYKKKQRQEKGLVDRVSAVIILQEFMERRR